MSGVHILENLEFAIRNMTSVDLYLGLYCQTDREMSISGQMENFEYGTPPLGSSLILNMKRRMRRGNHLWFPLRNDENNRYNPNDT